ncbi:GSE1_6 [Sanghuangporus weigelae]
MRGLRTSLDQLSEVNKALAERFESCNRHLELLIASSESHTTNSGTDVNRNHPYSASQEQKAVEEKLVQIRRLSEEQEAMINDIRRIPGFKSFLRAASFEEIQQAASEGPIIMLNFSKYRSDALIVLSSKDLPCELLQVRKKSGVGSKKYDGILRRVMKVLWDRVVSKFVQKLKEIRIAEGSRIWWCPTSVLTAFPFHAAGPYKGSDGKMKYLLDDYISSYTPTLMSLINARSNVQDGDGRMLFVGDTRLPSVNRERHSISRIRCIDEQLLDNRASPDMLQGGMLTLLDIARARLPNAEFAFLSACHTAEQRPTTALDESLHLAAAMQFCGFRSVICTMWQLLDQDGPFLAGNIYTRLMVDLEGEGGEMRYKRAAAAVREAALSLRELKEDVVDGKEVDIMAERWVNLVHIGV